MEYSSNYYYAKELNNADVDDYNDSILILINDDDDGDGDGNSTTITTNNNNNDLNYNIDTFLLWQCLAFIIIPLLGLCLYCTFKKYPMPQPP
jgi:hypothetical protein